MISFRQFLEDTDSAVQFVMPSAAPVASTFAVSSFADLYSPEFIRYIKNTENGIKKGWNSKESKWYPHKSFEGGTDTIAYGHKLKKGEDFSSGITEKQAIELLYSDLNQASREAKRLITRKYGAGVYDKLSIKQREILTDFVFNLGDVTRKFPKFTDAVIAWDLPTLRKEYKRYSGGKELLDRNKQFYNLYLK